MLRQALRRCATIRSIGAAPGLRNQLNGRNAFGHAPSSTFRPTAIPNAVSFLRYSSTAAEEVAQQEQEQQQEFGHAGGSITKFADLTSLGVHQKLLDTITRGMGYEKMTDVQSKTINSALLGKDLCVATS